LKFKLLKGESESVFIILIGIRIVYNYSTTGVPKTSCSPAKHARRKRDVGTIEYRGDIDTIVNIPKLVAFQTAHSMARKSSFSRLFQAVKTSTGHFPCNLVENFLITLNGNCKLPDFMASSNETMFGNSTIIKIDL
jgi:hypothetical protein